MNAAASDAAATQLQRGRAPESAESTKRPSRRSGVTAASTGPRSGERGVNTAVARGKARGLASTGPRSGERGVAVVDEVAVAAGRASTGPRSGERGVASARATGSGIRAMLQRGRAPESAESALLERARNRSRVASTGPRSGERGVQLGTVLFEVLGHASTGPRSGERGVDSPTRRWCRGSGRFNGAALRRARSQQDTPHTYETGVTLQRGRAPESAES